VSALAKEAIRCSFCGKSKDEVAKLIAGPGVYICNECVALCDDILVEEGGDDRIARWETMTDEDLLGHMVSVAASRDRVDESVGVVVRMLRSRGITWSRIGDALGITRQSAWERYSGED
jgi:hypothetical protein